MNVDIELIVEVVEFLGVNFDRLLALGNDIAINIYCQSSNLTEDDRAMFRRKDYGKEKNL
jgi:hypothetical protein